MLVSLALQWPRGNCPLRATSTRKPLRWGSTFRVGIGLGLGLGLSDHISNWLSYLNNFTLKFHFYILHLHSSSDYNNNFLQETVNPHTRMKWQLSIKLIVKFAASCCLRRDARTAAPSLKGLQETKKVYMILPFCLSEFLSPGSFIARIRILLQLGVYMYLTLTIFHLSVHDMVYVQKKWHFLQNILFSFYFPHICIL